MSVTGGQTDIETVNMRTDTPAAGSSDTVQVDAQENRRIHGFRINPFGIATGNDYILRGKLFVGVDPNVAVDSADDLGGKLFAEHEVVVDSTNGWAVVDSEDYPIEGADGASWDWNEDVTLTLEVDNGSSSTDGAGYEATVYYTEA